MKKLLCVATFFSCMTPRFHTSVSIYFILLVIILAIYLLLNRKVNISSELFKDVSVFIIWILFAIIQLRRSVGIAHSIWEMYFLIVGFLSVVIFNFIANDEDTFKNCFAAITFALLIHGFIGSYEIIAGRHLFEVGVSDTLELGKPVSIFLNRNDYLTFMFVSLAISMEYLKIKFKGRVLLFWVLSIVTWCMALILSVGSDTVVLTLIVLAIAFWAVKIPKKFDLFSRVLMLGGLLVTLCSLFFLYFRTVEMKFAEFELEELVRVNLIKNGLMFLMETGGLGIGYGNTQYYLQYKSIYNVGHVYYFHNWYLETLVCGGIIVFLFYMKFHLRILRRLYLLVTDSLDKYKPKDTSIIVLRSSNFVFTSFLIFSVVSISSSSNFYSEWIWMYLGLMSAYSNFLYKKYLYSHKLLLARKL